MVQTLECAIGRTGSRTEKSPSAETIQCGMSNVFFIPAAEPGADPDENELRCDGDDDDGGDSSSSSEDESQTDESDGDDSEEGGDEGDEDDGDAKGGKKKKKKVEARGGCGFMFYGIAALVLLSCCGCTIVGYMTGLIKPGVPSLAGTWEAKDTDGADLTLVLNEGGAGTYAKADEKSTNVKWTISEPKNLELELDDGKLWTAEKKTSFTYELVGTRLTLTAAPARSITFAKAFSDNIGASNKGGGTKKGKQK